MAEGITSVPARAPEDAAVAPRRSGSRLSAEERRKAVLVAAVPEFAQGGLAGTSTEAIARRAGISQPYLFRLFGSKRELFLATVRLGFGRTYEAFDRVSVGLTGEEALLAIAGAYAELIKDRDGLLLQLHAYAACGDPVVRAVVGSLYGDLVALVEGRAAVDDETLRNFFGAGMLWNVVAAIGLKEYEALGCPLPGWTLDPITEAPIGEAPIGE